MATEDNINKGVGHQWYTLNILQRRYLKMISMHVQVCYVNLLVTIIESKTQSNTNC